MFKNNKLYWIPLKLTLETPKNNDTDDKKNVFNEDSEEEDNDDANKDNNKSKHQSSQKDDTDKEDDNTDKTENDDNEDKDENGNNFEYRQKLPKKKPFSRITDVGGKQIEDDEDDFDNAVEAEEINKADVDSNSSLNKKISKTWVIRIAGQ